MGQKQAKSRAAARPKPPPIAAKGGESIAYFRNIYGDERLPKRAKLVYFYLFGRKNDQNVTWPGLNTIAKELSLSRSTVKRAVADLEKAGYLRKVPTKRENGSLTSNRYHVLK
jgi:DNA-binding MarR family transcriptional regulator